MSILQTSKYAVQQNKKNPHKIRGLLWMDFLNQWAL